MKYVCIDLKSFYASVECVDRGLDPLDANLVVADESRTEKTICLAVTPSLKRYGIPGRARLFEVVQKTEEINAARRISAPYRRFRGGSSLASELDGDPSLRLEYIVAKPRMARYMDVSAKVYGIYLKYIAPEDMHVYSIDEAFIDVTAYLRTYKCTARELAAKLIREVLKETGVTATAGVGDNLYLAKVAMDIVAKKTPADEDGVRIAELDERSYREKLWDHVPLTDFWRVGAGYAKRLERLGLRTMGDIARYSEYGEERLFKTFGVAAELIIDHAWGYEPCTMAAIKAYVPETRSASHGQVLSRPYGFEGGRLVAMEIAEQIALELVSKELVTKRLVLTVGYDRSGVPEDYDGEYKLDRYGRKVPRSARGSIELKRRTSSAKAALEAIKELYDSIVDERLLVRRMTVVAEDVLPESQAEEEFLQYSLFDDAEETAKEREREELSLKRERAIQRAELIIKRRFGKNAIFKGMDLQEGATTRERNEQVGGHKA